MTDERWCPTCTGGPGEHEPECPNTFARQAARDPSFSPRPIAPAQLAVGEDSVAAAVRARVLASEDPAAVIAALRALLHELAPQHAQPIDHVRWVPLEDVTPNDYNPNSVARQEMQLLLRSIDHDGYTQPIVTIQDPETGKYVIVDGFHRYFVMKTTPEIARRCGGRLPVVVIEKGINDRMASTVRHNRARGKHSVTGMANMVFAMLDRGMDDAAICNELGMEAEELLRLKHITGFSKLFADREYNRSWVSRNQILVRQAHKAKEAAG